MSEPIVTRRIAEEQETAVGRILSDLRRSKGWTLSEVSKMTGVAISTLSKIENGQTQPAYSVLTRLAAGLEIDFVDLLGGSTTSGFPARRAPSPGPGRVRAFPTTWAFTKRSAAILRPSRCSPC